MFASKLSLFTPRVSTRVPEFSKLIPIPGLKTIISSDTAAKALGFVQNNLPSFIPGVYYAGVFQDRYRSHFIKIGVPPTCKLPPNAPTTVNNVPIRYVAGSPIIASMAVAKRREMSSVHPASSSAPAFSSVFHFAIEAYEDDCNVFGVGTSVFDNRPALLVICNDEADVPDSLMGFPVIKEVCDSGFKAHAVEPVPSHYQNKHSPSYVIGRPDWNETFLSTITCAVSFPYNNLLAGKNFALGCGHSYFPFGTLMSTTTTTTLQEVPTVYTGQTTSIQLTDSNSIAVGWGYNAEQNPWEVGAEAFGKPKIIQIGPDIDLSLLEICNEHKFAQVSPCPVTMIRDFQQTPLQCGECLYILSRKKVVKLQVTGDKFRAFELNCLDNYMYSLVDTIIARPQYAFQNAEEIAALLPGSSGAQVVDERGRLAGMYLGGAYGLNGNITSCCIVPIVNISRFLTSQFGVTVFK